MGLWQARRAALGGILGERVRAGDVMASKGPRTQVRRIEGLEDYDPRVESAPSADVIALVFDKERFGQKQAREWAQKRGFDDKAVEETPLSWHVLQGEVQEGTHLTKVRLGDGIAALVVEDV